ncbi:MAG TPA: hypothetical protein VIX82_01105, partial [Solirubrobacteraceae bacterium]
MNTDPRSNNMEMTRDLIVIHRELLGAARHHSARSRRRSPLVAGVAGCGVVLLAATALAASVGFVNIGWLQISTKAELPASLRGVPVATLLANDANLQSCRGNGWVGPLATMQSPHAPGTIAGCRTPTRAQREAYRVLILQNNPSLAHPYGYWYRLTTKSLASTQGRPGAAAALGGVYLGSQTPLTPKQIVDSATWNDDNIVTGVGEPPSKTALSVTAPLPKVKAAPSGGSTGA